MRKAFMLAALALTALMSASSASATTWTSNGSATGTGFTATSAAIKFTLSGVAAGINCTTSGLTGSLYGPTGIVGTGRTADVTLAISGCRAGSFSWNVTCTPRALQWLVTSYNAPIVSGWWRAAAVPFCTVTIPSIAGCTINFAATAGIGAAIGNVSYNDTTAAMTLATSGQAITATWSSCGTTFGTASGSAAATFTNTAGAALVYRVTSAFVPNVTI
jgi:hypothetical protein